MGGLTKILLVALITQLNQNEDFSFKKVRDDAYIFTFNVDVNENQEAMLDFITDKGIELGYEYFAVQKYLPTEQKRKKTITKFMIGVFDSLDKDTYVVFFKYPPDHNYYKIQESTEQLIDIELF